MRLFIFYQISMAQNWEFSILETLIDSFYILFIENNTIEMRHKL